MEYELTGSALGGLDNALVGQLGCPFLFLYAVCAFKDCGFIIVGSERVKHVVKVGHVGTSVVFVAEEDTGCAAASVPTKRT